MTTSKELMTIYDASILSLLGGDAQEFPEKTQEQTNGHKKVARRVTERGDTHFNDQEVKQKVNACLEEFHVLNGAYKRFMELCTEPQSQERKVTVRTQTEKFEKEILALNCELQIALSQAVGVNEDIFKLNKQKKVRSSHADHEC